MTSGERCRLAGYQPPSASAETEKKEPAADAAGDGKAVVKAEPEAEVKQEGELKQEGEPHAHHETDEESDSEDEEAEEEEVCR